MEPLRLSYATVYSFSSYHKLSCYHALTPLSLPHMILRSISNRRGVASRQSHSLTLWLVGQWNPPLIHLAALSNAEAGRSGGGWHNVDDSKVETNFQQCLKHSQWEALLLPVGVGAVAVAVATRQKPMLFFSFTFLFSLLVHKALKVQGGKFVGGTTVSLQSLLHTVKTLIVSRGIIILKAIAAIYSGIRRIHVYVNNFMTDVISFLAPNEQSSIVGKRELNGLPLKGVLDLNMIQTQGGKSLKRDDLVPSDLVTQAEKLDMVLSDIRKCVYKLEGMIDKEHRSLTLDDVISCRLKELSDLLKGLISDLSSTHDLSHLQLAKAMRELEKQSVEALLSLSGGNQENRIEILDRRCPEIGEGHQSNPDLKQFKLEAVNLSASDNLPVSCRGDVDQVISELAEVNRQAAQKGFLPPAVSANLSLHHEASRNNNTNDYMSNSGAVSGSEGAHIFQEISSQGEYSSSMGCEVDLPSLRSKSDIVTSEGGSNQRKNNMVSDIHPSDTVHDQSIQTSMVNGNGALKRESILPETSHVDIWQPLTQNGLRSDFDSSRATYNPRKQSEENNMDYNRSTSSGEARLRGNVYSGMGSDELKRNLWTHGPPKDGNLLSSTTTAPAGDFDTGGNINGRSEGKEGRNTSEQERITRREIEALQEDRLGNVVSKIEGHKDGSLKFMDSLDDAGVEPFGNGNQRTTYSKLGSDQKDNTENEAGRSAPGETRHSVVKKEPMDMSSRGFSEHSFLQPNFGDSQQSSGRKKDETFSSESIKQVGFTQQYQDMLMPKGLSRSKLDREFHSLMNEGEALFTKGKTGLSGKIKVGVAEAMLYKAADLFASAAALDPSSMEAVGFWGNTLLVHGELKLKLSRELRMMLPSADTPSFYQSKRGGMAEKDWTKDENEEVAIQQTLQVVCEECEELFVEAGRKYRMALSINKNDVRALYNWGLALCSRAQLISEEAGQNAAEDADKVYLAAIDKFEAMMGISQRYAPGAMLNWGLALRDRSRLRPIGSQDRIKLLQQAKQLFQDAMRLHPNDAQIRGAFATCSVELTELQESKKSESIRGQRLKLGNW